MEYTVKSLAKLAKITPRTIRYYDEINLLKPNRINSSGYRIYGEKEVDKLQQIMLYRELGLELECIKKIIDSESFNEVDALKQHLFRLIEKKHQINTLITNVEKTLAMKEGFIKMKDNEKFEGFKAKLLNENEEKYGEELRQKYSKESLEKSYNTFKNMSKSEYDKMQQLSEAIIRGLVEAKKTNNPCSSEAFEVANNHKQWITMCWGYYNEEAHRGLVKMYVADDRFKQYYDKHGSGLAEFLRDSVIAYLNK